MNLSIQSPDQTLEGRLQGIRSKSISNRLLIMSALRGHSIDPAQLSRASDTRELYQALKQPSDIHELEGGTSFRFYLAYRFAIDEPVTLYPKGSMRGRPIGPLVSALEHMGGHFDYLDKAGRPPVRFNGRSDQIPVSEINIDSTISSQFASAVALVAPVLDRPITIHYPNEMSSVSYLSMTIDLMNQYGIKAKMERGLVKINPSEYTIEDPDAEGDWSGASFFYALAALYPSADLFIPYLPINSIQPDSKLSDWFESWSVQTTFEKTGIRILKTGETETPEELQMDFSNNPDLALPVLICAALSGTSVNCRGLDSLPHKESNRLEILKNILQRLNASFDVSDSRCSLTPPDFIPDYSNQIFSSAGDHRVAMSLSLLSAKHPICVAGADAVEKSYPHFWKELEYLGFQVKDC